MIVLIRRIAAFALLALLLGVLMYAFLRTPSAHAATALPLSGIVVVLDPGHGGNDPGAHGTYRLSKTGDMVTVDEAPSAMDVAKRLVPKIQKAGGVVYLTRNGDQYAIGGARVRALTQGMLPRMAVANEAKRKYGENKCLVFLSIHFDAERDATLEEAHVIAPAGETPRIVSLLENAFKKNDRIRTKDGEEYLPITVSGDGRHGIRNLYVLRRTNNPIQERAIVELGNLKNQSDVYRARTESTREAFADTILEALTALGKEKVACVARSRRS